MVALAAIAVSGCALGTGGSASALAANGSADGAAGCAADAYRAIRAHERLTSAPAACQALTPGQPNVAVGLAIRMASGTGSKSVWRRQTRAAAAFVSALITGPEPIMTAPSASSAPGGTLAASGGSRLGFNELATKVAALLAWLATAGSGGWILIRWWRAGGRPTRPRGRADTAAPAAAILGHVGLGLLGLAVWTRPAESIVTEAVRATAGGRHCRARAVCPRHPAARAARGDRCLSRRASRTG
jgi:hypothetical protein